MGGGKHIRKERQMHLHMETKAFVRRDKRGYVNAKRVCYTCTFHLNGTLHVVGGM